MSEEVRRRILELGTEGLQGKLALVETQYRIKSHPLITQIVEVKKAGEKVKGYYYKICKTGFDRDLLIVKSGRSLSLLEPVNLDGHMVPRVANFPRNYINIDNITNIWLGKPDILAYCDERGWDAHKRWIEILSPVQDREFDEYPKYRFPGLKQVFYIDLSELKGK